jgi:hypothetical protein
MFEGQWFLPISRLWLSILDLPMNMFFFWDSHHLGLVASLSMESPKGLKLRQLMKSHLGINLFFFCDSH